jgi:hypothetical protein
VINAVNNDSGGEDKDFRFLEPFPVADAFDRVFHPVSFGPVAEQEIPGGNGKLKGCVTFDMITSLAGKDILFLLFTPGKNLTSPEAAGTFSSTANSM